MTDVINREWILARLDTRHGAKSAMADAIGMDRTKFAKVLKGKRRLSAEEIAKVIDYFDRDEVQVFALEESPSQDVGGFSDGEVTPYRATSRQSEAQLLTICRSLAPSAAHASVMRAAQDLASFSILAGDFLVVDLQPTPKQGDLAICQLYDEQLGHAVSIVRQYLPPFYVTRDGSSENAIVPETDPNLRVAATLVASFRAPELAV